MLSQLNSLNRSRFLFLGLGITAVLIPLPHDVNEINVLIERLREHDENARFPLRFFIQCLYGSFASIIILFCFLVFSQLARIAYFLVKNIDFYQLHHYAKSFIETTIVFSNFYFIFLILQAFSREQLKTSLGMPSSADETLLSSLSDVSLFGGDGFNERSWSELSSIGTSIGMYFDSFYVSVSTITTLGYCDIYPGCAFFKAVSLVEVAIGLYIVTIGISRYFSDSSTRALAGSFPPSPSQKGARAPASRIAN